MNRISLKLATLILFALSVLIAIQLLHPGIDHITHWVISFVVPLEDGAWYKPYRIPPPMDDYGFRPFSVLGLKLAVNHLFVQGLPPPWLIFLKSMLSAFFFGVSSMMWVRSHGGKAWALPVSMGVMITTIPTTRETIPFRTATSVWGTGGLTGGVFI